jgi:hypothetical protein
MEEPSQNADIVAFLQAAEKWMGDELELTRVHAGDRLLVRTKNTSYLFQMTGRHTALMSTNRADRPSGKVQIQGCVFGRSSMIKPDHLFCGGGIEITIDEGRRKFTTSPIEAIQLVSSNLPPDGMR